MKIFIRQIKYFKINLQYQFDNTIIEALKKSGLVFELSILTQHPKVNLSQGLITGWGLGHNSDLYKTSL